MESKSTGKCNSVDDIDSKRQIGESQGSSSIDTNSSSSDPISPTANNCVTLDQHSNLATSSSINQLTNQTSITENPDTQTSNTVYPNRSRTTSVSVTNGPESTRACTMPKQKCANLASIHSLHPQMDLKLNKQFMLMPMNDQIRELQTVIRDRDTSRGNFKFYANRLIRLVVEEGLNHLPTENVAVNSPTGNVFNGIRYKKGNCGVSIVRSGESMEQGLRDCCRSVRIGKILVESDENNQARVLYAKFPKDIAERKILLLYPIMSTGLSVIESVRVLLNHGVKEENLILLNLFCSPKASKIINNSFPRMFVLTSDINPVCPNHFGQRYFGTD